jgi:hypothetical protein
VAEWFKATVLKTVGLKGPVGSNPTLSAILKKGGKTMSKIIFASLEAKLYVWLAGLDYSVMPKKALQDSLKKACESKLKEVYPKANNKEIREMTIHLFEYAREVFKKDI